MNHQEAVSLNGAKVARMCPLSVAVLAAQAGKEAAEKAHEDAKQSLITSHLRQGGNATGTGQLLRDNVYRLLDIYDAAYDRAGHDYLTRAGY